MTTIDYGFFKRLRKIDGYLCPEPGNAWSVCSCDNSSDYHVFTGWGDTPEEALSDAEKQFINFNEAN